MKHEQNIMKERLEGEIRKENQVSESYTVLKAPLPKISLYCEKKKKKRETVKTKKIESSNKRKEIPMAYVSKL